MRAEAIYSALLRCYPLAFRDEYGDEMRLMFAEQLVDARRDGGRLKELALWAGAAADAVFVAPREHCHVILQDLRYAVRTMMARPGFTAVAIISLALGIGANTAIFSLWHGVLRATLPVVQKPDELVMLTDPGEAGMLTGRWESRTDGPRAWVSYAEFEQLRDNVSGFASIMASQSSLPALQARVGGGAQEPVRARLVSGAFFQVLGGRAALGRVFSSDVDRADTSEVVISHAYWQRRFGGRADVLGETLTIRQAALTIVGVAAPGFVGETNGQQPDAWIPLRHAAERDSRQQLAARGASGQVDVAPRLRAAGARRHGRSGRGAGQPRPAIQSGVVLWRGRVGQSPAGVPRSTSADSARRSRRLDTARAVLVCPDGSHVRRRHPAAHRLRQPREPAARARRGAANRDDAAIVARCRSRPADAAARDGEPRAGDCWAASRRLLSRIPSTAVSYACSRKPTTPSPEASLSIR